MAASSVSGGTCVREMRKKIGRAAYTCRREWCIPCYAGYIASQEKLEAAEKDLKGRIEDLTSSSMGKPAFLRSAKKALEEMFEITDPLILMLAENPLSPSLSTITNNFLRSIWPQRASESFTPLLGGGLDALVGGVCGFASSFFCRYTAMITFGSAVASAACGFFLDREPLPEKRPQVISHIVNYMLNTAPEAFPSDSLPFLESLQEKEDFSEESELHTLVDLLTLAVNKSCARAALNIPCAFEARSSIKITPSLSNLIIRYNMKRVLYTAVLAIREDTTPARLFNEMTSLLKNRGQHCELLRNITCDTERNWDKGPVFEICGSLSAFTKTDAPVRPHDSLEVIKTHLTRFCKNAITAIVEHSKDLTLQLCDVLKKIIEDDSPPSEGFSTLVKTAQDLSACKEQLPLEKALSLARLLEYDTTVASRTISSHDEELLALKESLRTRVEIDITCFSKNFYTCFGKCLSPENKLQQERAKSLLDQLKNLFLQLKKKLNELNTTTLGLVSDKTLKMVREIAKKLTHLEKSLNPAPSKSRTPNGLLGATVFPRFF